MASKFWNEKGAYRLISEDFVPVKGFFNYVNRTRNEPIFNTEPRMRIMYFYHATYMAGALMAGYGIYKIAEDFLR